MKHALGLASVTATALSVVLAGCGGTPATAPSVPPNVSAAPSASVENPAPGDHNLPFIDANGDKKRFLVHAPPGYSPTKKWPLVLVFHGQPGAAEDMVVMTKMNEVADANGFLVVYPHGIREVPSILAILDRLGPKWSVDPKRVHATGFSRGAAFTYELAEKAPERFGSVAPVSGAGGEGKPLASPVSLLTFQGDRDRIQTAFVTANTNWAKAAGCTGEQVKSITMEKGPTTVKTSSCEGGTEHIIYSISTMSHEWPADAGKLMWEFFNKHPLAG